MRLFGDAEKALELAGEIAALLVLDQRGGAHRARALALVSLCPPSREQRLQDAWRNRLLVEAEPDLDRQAPLHDHVGSGEAAHQVVEAERGDLRAIGVRAQAKAARRRQPRLRERREVRRLRPDAVGIGGRRGAQRDDELLIVGVAPLCPRNAS